MVMVSFVVWWLKVMLVGVSIWWMRLMCFLGMGYVMSVWFVKFFVFSYFLLCSVWLMGNMVRILK